jgi:hypothetical protein
MYELAYMASIDYKIPGTKKPLFLSVYNIDKIKGSLKVAIDKKTPIRLPSIHSRVDTELDNLISVAALLKFPAGLKKKIEEILLLMTHVNLRMLKSFCEFALSYASQFGNNGNVTLLICKSLRSELTRSFILEKDISWETIWNGKISKDGAKSLLDSLESEVKYHDEDVIHGREMGDYDIAYLCDIAKRIENGMIIDESCEVERDRARKLLEKANSFYESVSSLEINSTEAPDANNVIEEIDSINKEKEDEGQVGEDDIPF